MLFKMVVFGFAYLNIYTQARSYIYALTLQHNDKSTIGGEAGNYITIDSCKMNPPGQACDHKQSTAGR